MTLSTAQLLIVRMFRAGFPLGLFFFLFYSTSFSQSSDSCTRLASYQKTYHSDSRQYTYDAVQLSNGDIATCGDYQVSLVPNGTNIDALAMRFNAAGDILWATRFGNLARTERFSRIKPTSDGGVIACGYAESLTPKSVMLAVKFSSTGVVQWSSAFNAFSDNGEIASDIVQTPDGGYAMIGTYNAYTFAPSDVVVVKLNANGAQMWSRIYDGGESDWGTSISTIGDTIVVCGYHNTTANSSHNAFVMKIRSDGSFWGGKTYDRGGKDERFKRLEPFAGGFVISEQTADDAFFTNGGYALTVVNNDGDVLLSKKTNFNTYIRGTVMYKRTSDNGFIGVAGDMNNDPRIFKLDASGNVEWKKLLPRYGDQQLHAVFQLADGSYMAGGHYSNGLFLDMDAYLVKLDAQGRTNGCATDSAALTVEDVPLSSQPLNWTAIRPVILNVVNTSALTAYTPVEQANELCVYTPCNPPAPTCFTTFQKSYSGGGNDEGLNAITTADRGSIVCGRTTSGTTGDNDGFLLKLDGQGLVQWSKKYGGSQHDELQFVIATTDGNYVAAGVSQSFGQPAGTLWVIKTDATGNLLWSRQYSGNGRERPKKLIELSNGQLVIAGNTNDSTAQNNGWLLQLTSNGNVTWSKQYDHGNNDGLNDVIQNGDTLIVTGYASVGMKTGVIAKVRQSDGAVIWAQQYKKEANTNIELTNVYSIPDGYAFSAWSSTIRMGTFFKMRSNGQKFFEVQTHLFTASGQRQEYMKMTTSRDEGFVYLVSDTTDYGFTEFSMIGPTGMGEWRRSTGVTDGNFQRIYSVALASDRGYLLTGYYSNFTTTNNKRRIKVLRTDELGRTGQCTLNTGSVLTDTSKFGITNFTWSNVSDYILTQSGPVATSATAYPLSIFTDCAKTTCDTTQQLADSCARTFKFDLSGTYKVLTSTAIRTSDGGYMVAGDYASINAEPLLIKLASNGSVQWAKTFNDFRHSGGFRTLLDLGDGNVLALGTDNFVINHGSSDSLLLLKISHTGNVVWMRRIGSVYGSVHGRIKLLADGNILLFINNDIGFPPLDNYILKLDQSGNILWQKKDNRTLGNIITRDVIIDGSVMYTVSDVYNPNPKNHVQLAKYDLNTGQSIYSKRLAASDRHVIPYRAFLEQDTLYIPVGMTYDQYPNYEFNLGLIKVNAQTGAPYSTIRTSTPNFLFIDYYVLYHWRAADPILMDRTADGGYVFTSQNRAPIDSGLVIGKVSRDGAIAWIKRYPNIKSNPQTLRVQDGELFISLFIKNPVEQIVTSSSFIKTDSVGNIKEGATSGLCYSVPMNGTMVPMQLDTSTRWETGYVNTTDVGYTSFSPYVRDVQVRADENCVVPANCDMLILSGPDSVCNLLDDYTFQATRNAGCNNAVNWVVDTSFATILSRTDSTVTIRFKRSGQTSVIGQLTSGCRLMSKNKLITIPPLSQEISLGDDRTICPGNQFILQAGNGYRSYLWQDGSTDPVYTVTQPGTYHVRVTDVCNRSSSDTVVVTPAAPFSVNLGPDISKCDTQSVTLIAPAGFAKYSWTPSYNISSLTIPVVRVNPDTSTSYSVLVERADGCMSSDTIRVIVHHAPRINLGSDTSFCTGQSVILDAGAGFVTYNWNTGATTQQITANVKGIYYVEGTDANSCLSRDTFEVRSLFALPSVNLGKDTFFCSGSNYTFDAGNFVSYEWSDGSTGRRFTVTQIGSYWVKVTDANTCVNSDTAQILKIAPLPQGFLDSLVEFCSYDKATLSPIGNYVHYRWSTGSIARTIEVNTPGRYWLEVTNADGCVEREYIDVKHKTCPSFIHFPNAFTPNNDRVNDTYKPVTSGKFVKYRFTVYNRWGQKVFETSDPQRAWDGTLGGLPQDSNAFVWYCSYQFEGQPEKNAKGTLMLVR